MEIINNSKIRTGEGVVAHHSLDVGTLILHYYMIAVPFFLLREYNKCNYDKQSHALFFSSANSLGLLEGSIIII